MKHDLKLSQELLKNQDGPRSYRTLLKDEIVSIARARGLECQTSCLSLETYLLLIM